MKLQLRFPANVESVVHHAELAVRLAHDEFDCVLDFSPSSLEDLDQLVESLRDTGSDAEAAAEALFVCGCYLGEVLVRGLRGSWVPTGQSALAGLSAWPMVVRLPDGSTWDAIGKLFRRFEVGDSEYLPAFYYAASRGNHPA
jgi:hypothetical protein